MQRQCSLLGRLLGKYRAVAKTATGSRGHSMRLASTILLLALGAASALAQATVTTDQSDYPPGSMASITGAGFQPNESVQLQVLRIDINENSGPEHDPWTVTADANGGFTSYWEVTTDELGATLQLSATGQTSWLTAQRTFTDGNASDGSGSMTVSPASATAGSSGNSFTFQFQTDKGKDYAAASQVTILVPAGWTAPQTSSSSSPGYVSTTNVGNGVVSGISVSGSGPWTIIIDFGATKNGNGFNVTSAGGGTQVTAPGPTGIYTFTTQTRNSIGTGGVLTTVGASPSITVNVGTATRLIVTLPNETFTSGSGNSGTVANQTAGTSFNITRLTVVDDFNNIITAYSGAKTISYSGPANSPSGSAPTYTTSVSFTAGQSTTTLSTTLKKAATTTITATDGALTAVASSSLTVVGATADHLVFSTSPAGAVYKTAFSTQPVVQTQDIYGNNSTTGLGATVTVNLILSTGTGPLVGTTSLNIGTSGGNGTATFSDLQVNKAENGDLLTVAVTGLTSGTSAAFNITAATVAISSGITANNKTYSATTAATINSNSVVLSGVLSGDTANVALSTNGYTATFASAAKANGVTVTVSGLSLTGTAAGNYTLTAPSLSANVMAASTTSAVTCSANPALPGASVSFTSTLSVTAPGGGTPTGSVSFKDAASVLGAGSLNGSGVATFSTSSLAHGNHVITAEYAGDGNFLGSTNSLGTNQVINTAPVASLATYTRSSGLSYKILISSLLTNSTSDSDGDARTLTAVGSSTDGATITKSGAWIFYVPPPASNVNSNATDYFSYTISDGFTGGTASGMISMAVTSTNVSTPSANLMGVTAGTNGITVSFVGIPGYTHHIQRMTTVSGTNTAWTNVGACKVNGAGKGTFTDSSPPSPAYYRTSWP